MAHLGEDARIERTYARFVKEFVRLCSFWLGAARFFLKLGPSAFEVQSMPLSLRQSEILDLARAEGRVLVEDLAQRFGVTLQTIRRDLTELADAGRLERVHGGAVLKAGVANIGYAERRRMNAEAKAAIGRACAAAIPDNSSLFVNIGTTTEAVARELLAHRNLTVVTNNLNVANILAESESCDVIVAGGVLRRSDGGLVGDLTKEAIEAFKVDFAIIGTSALDGDGDLLDFDSQEVRVSRAIIRQARRTFLVADHSKLARTAPVRIASLAEIHTLFTDRRLPADLAAKCASWETRIVVSH
jgi:DeoR family glycerol-3-phosphate regulon repressor